MVNNSSVGNFYDIVTEPFARFKTDITCAWYGGDYSLTLEQAQKNKYDKVLNGIGFTGRKKDGKPFRVLDIGCGWGYFLEEIRNRGGEAVGVTLSNRQAEDAVKRGLDVRVQDWKELLQNKTLHGTFDGIISVGSFEHYVSPKEYLEGKREDVYRNYFDTCKALLVPNGKMYLQTMTFTPKGEEIAKRIAYGYETFNKAYLDDYILTLLKYFFPDSCLPNGFEQIEKISSTHFNILSHNSGRQDYIVTCREWNKLYASINTLEKIRIFFKFLPSYLRHREFRLMSKSCFFSSNQKAFVRELFEHERIFMQKKG